MINELRSLARTLFRIRRPRAVPPARTKPGVGARVTHGEYRMIVQAGMTDSLWIWLAQQGWREVTYRPDRRRYLDIPHAFVTELIDAGPDDRAADPRGGQGRGELPPADTRAPPHHHFA